ncbi:MAG: putative prokaryotic signal transducing protein [Verrucomicrobiales bacterium]|nr:putative prokaryotic signal transducing protein [Verrucomicrobiales bacterium]
MKKVLSAMNSGEASLIQSVLEGAGLVCELRNDAVSQAMTGFAFAPEIWVRDEDYDEAVVLITESRAN